MGVSSTEGRGLWAERDNVLCLAYNRVHCGGKLLPGEHDFNWTWEASFKQNAASPTLIENNVNVTYADGTTHRPWALYVDTQAKRAGFSFQSSSGVINFHVNPNGNVVIGPRYRQPSKQLEVVGSQLVTGTIEAQGGLAVQGLSACWVPLASGQRVLGACDDF
jgi:hypothetical protein